MGRSRAADTDRKAAPQRPSSLTMTLREAGVQRECTLQHISTLAAPECSGKRRPDKDLGTRAKEYTASRHFTRPPDGERPEVTAALPHITRGGGDVVAILSTGAKPTAPRIATGTVATVAFVFYKYTPPLPPHCRRRYRACKYSVHCRFSSVSSKL